MNRVSVLDMGCGTFLHKGKVREDVTSIDYRQEVHPTVVHDLNKYLWPSADNSFDVILCLPRYGTPEGQY